MLEKIKEKVLKANLLLPKHGLITFTWGNASEIDRSVGLVVIKPSGVEYSALKVEDMVVVDLAGKIIEGRLNPSSDTATHLEIYKAWPEINGIVHTHSCYATSWAQARKEIPCYGTTHADYIRGSVPVTRKLTDRELIEYEKNIGLTIVETFKGKDYKATPCILCSNHGPFTWGKDSLEAVHNAIVLEECAKMALFTELISPESSPAPTNIQDKHYYRKHGEKAYYGQLSRS